MIWLFLIAVYAVLILLSALSKLQQRINELKVDKARLDWLALTKEFSVSRTIYANDPEQTKHRFRDEIDKAMKGN